jgi:hypothetical protein
VFLLNVPIAALAVLRGLRLPDSRATTGTHSLAGLDWWGVAAVSSFVLGGRAGHCRRKEPLPTEAMPPQSDRRQAARAAGGL